jgi:hypothetical protein
MCSLHEALSAGACVFCNPTYTKWKPLAGSIKDVFLVVNMCVGGSAWRVKEYNPLQSYFQRYVHVITPVIKELVSLTIES